MTDKVNESPSVVAGAFLRPDVFALTATLGNLVRMVFNEFRAHALRLNKAVQLDGSEAMSGPLMVASYTVSTLPTASDYPQGVIYVSDETGGATLAFSDATNWRRVQDRAIVS